MGVLKKVIFIGLVTWGVGGCFYDPDRDKIPPEEDSETEESTDDSPGIDGGVDAGESTSAGLGETCYEDADCGADGTNLCLKQLTDMADPTKPGACTIEGCEQGACPDQHRCCDCDFFGTVCMPEEMIDATVQTYCSC